MSDQSAAPPPTRIAPAQPPDRSTSTALQVGVAVVAGLYLAREVLIPITLAVLLSFLLAPVVGWLRRVHVPRVPAVLLSVLFALALVVSVGGLIGTQVASLARDAPRYAVTVEQKIEAVRSYAVGRLAGLVAALSHRPEPGGGGAAATPTSPAAPADGAAPAPAPAPQPGASPWSIAERILSPILSPLSTLAIVFVFTVFILLQQADLRDRMIRLFGSGDLHRTTSALDDAGHRLSRYFLAQFGVNVTFGCVIAAGLYFIGVPSPVLFGVLGGLLRFVPYIGPFLAAALPLALAASVEPGWSMVAWTAGLFVITEGITGQVIEPMLYGHSTGLSPFAVVVAATFWTWLWGPIGLILSTPLTLCLVVMGRHVQRLEFLDVLLGDRPALTPVESFYQRMLADDPDEAQDQAELLLKEHALSSYYDEVALKGLQLAANDLERGVLDGPQLDRIRHAIQSLVADLDHHDDTDPKPDPAKAHAPSSTEHAIDKHERPASALPERWHNPAAVLCLAGRGPLDQAASAMLAQLLQKHGIGARVVAHEAASRGRIGALDLTGVAMICISYLQISGSPSHLRYLIQRLRLRAPGCPILVGLWPNEDAVLKDERLRTVIGADDYSSSLREAVDACLERAGTERTAAGPPGAPAVAL